LGSTDYFKEPPGKLKRKSTNGSNSGHCIKTMLQPINTVYGETTLRSYSPIFTDKSLKKFIGTYHVFP